MLLHQRHQRVVATHQVGTSHPADAGLGEGHVVRPDAFSGPFRQDGIEGCLDFAVGAVAAEGAAVRGTGQHHVHAGTNTSGGKICDTGDGAFHAPQQQACLVFCSGAGIGQAAGHAGCGEGEHQGGGQRGLGDLHVFTHGDFLLGANPLDQGVHVTEGGHVGGHQPQLRVGGSVVGVEGAGVFLAGIVDVGGRHDDGCAACQQFLHQRTGDGAGGCAGDQGNILDPRLGGFLGGNLGHRGKGLSEFLVGGLSSPPCGLFCYNLTGSGETLHGNVGAVC